jgi:hypothetical protein
MATIVLAMLLIAAMPVANVREPRSSMTVQNERRARAKPVVISANQYVSPGGNDSNDGLSWGTAKLTVMAAYDALPIKGGTINITSDSDAEGKVVTCVNASATAGQGIWIAGRTDPNFSNLPRGWVKAKQTGVSFVGVSSTNHSSGANYPQTCVISGSTSSDAIRLSGSNGGVSFFNLAFQAAKRGMVIGEDSSGVRTGSGIWTGLWVQNVGFEVSSASPSNGPTLDCTGGSFQLYFEDDQFSSNPSAPRGSNQAVAFLMDGANGKSGGCGLTTIKDAHFNGGGLKFIPGPSTGSFQVVGAICEAQTGPDACVHITNSLNLTAFVANVDVADCSGDVVGVQVDTQSGIASDNVFTQGINSACTSNVRGEMTTMNGYATVAGAQTASPGRQGQVGFIRGHVIGQEDAARRGFSPTSVRFRNLVLSPSQWTVPRGLLKTGFSAPDGTTGAVQGSTTNAQTGLIMATGNQDITGGDYWLAGVWVRSQTNNGYAGGVNNLLNFSIGSGTSALSTSFGHGAPWAGDGEWEWVWSLMKIIKVPSARLNVELSVQLDRSHTIQAYGPVVIRIPAASDVSANEAYEIAYNLQSYSNACVIGSVCGLVGQTLSQTFVIPNNGASFAAANATLSSGWGDRAVVSAAFGSAQRFTFTVKANGVGLAAGPTMSIAFPTVWPVSPIFSCKQVGGSGGLTVISGEDTATKTMMRLTFNGIPTTGSSYVFVCQGE